MAIWLDSLPEFRPAVATSGSWKCPCRPVSHLASSRLLGPGTWTLRIELLIAITGIRLRLRFIPTARVERAGHQVGHILVVKDVSDGDQNPPTNSSRCPRHTCILAPVDSFFVHILATLKQTLPVNFPRYTFVRPFDDQGLTHIRTLFRNGSLFPFRNFYTQNQIRGHLDSGSVTRGH